MVVLGVDPTSDKRWHAIFETEFAAQLLFCGFCDSRDEYGHSRHGPPHHRTAHHRAAHHTTAHRPPPTAQRSPPTAHRTNRPPLKPSPLTPHTTHRHRHPRPNPDLFTLPSCKPTHALGSRFLRAASNSNFSLFFGGLAIMTLVHRRQICTVARGERRGTVDGKPRDLWCRNGRVWVSSKVSE